MCKKKYLSRVSGTNRQMCSLGQSLAPLSERRYSKLTIGTDLVSIPDECVKFFNSLIYWTESNATVFLYGCFHGTKSTDVGLFCQSLIILLFFPGSTQHVTTDSSEASRCRGPGIYHHPTQQGICSHSTGKHTRVNHISTRSYHRYR